MNESEHEILIEIHELIISMEFFLIEEDKSIDNIDVDYLIALKNALEVEIRDRIGDFH